MAKKKAGNFPLNERKNWLNALDETISLNEQLILSKVSKTAYYYEAIPESEENLIIMNAIDQIYTNYPFYGARRISVLLQKKNFIVNRKRVRRLMQLMGLKAIYPKKNLSKSRQEDKKYPYLLNQINITMPNQVWSTDITYIPIKGGFLYLTAILDWYTRYVLSWRLSNTLDVNFCLDALEEALKTGKPEIFNTDQGSQYTSKEFTGVLERNHIKISMDGKGRAFDNIFIERLWRSVKYEEVYIKRYETGIEAKKGIQKYLKFYNEERVHQSLNYSTPKSLYFKGV